jgi:predicted MFS family arabinose efflux permease
MGSMVLLYATLYFTTTLHFTKAEAGFIMSFFGMGSILGSYFGGWLADRFAQKKIMLLSLLSSGAILLCINYTTNKIALASIIFLYAFTSDVFRPSSSVAITNSSTPQTRTRSISFMRMAINLGFSVGPAIGGVVAYNYGYHFLFVIDACTSFMAAGILFLFFPNKNFSMQAQTKTITSITSTSAYADYKFLQFIFLVTLYGICFFQLLNSTPAYFKEVCKYPENIIGYLMAANGLLVVLIELPLVSYLEKNKNPIKYIAIGCISIIVANIFLLLGHGVIALSMLYIIFITCSEIFAMPFMMSHVLNTAPTDRQGQYSALYSMGYGVSLIAAPAIGLYVAQHFGFNFLFVGAMGVSALLVIGFYRLVKK